MSEWACSMCTYLNPSSRTICEICGTKRPINQPQAPTPKPAVSPTTSTSRPVLTSPNTAKPFGSTPSVTSPSSSSSTRPVATTTRPTLTSPTSVSTRPTLDRKPSLPSSSSTIAKSSSSTPKSTLGAIPNVKNPTNVSVKPHSSTPTAASSSSSSIGSSAVNKPRTGPISATPTASALSLKANSGSASRPESGTVSAPSTPASPITPFPSSYSTLSSFAPSPTLPHSSSSLSAISANQFNMGIPGSHSVPIGNGPAAGRPIGGGPAAGPAAGSVSNGSSRAMHNGGGHILGSGRSQDSQSMRSTERKDGMMINNDDSKERELVMQRLQEVKLSKEEEERKRMHEAIERENAMMKDLEEFREKRKEKERALVSMFHDPRDAIANIKEEYGAARLQLVCSSVVRVLDNLVENPANPIYRRVSKKSEAAQKAFIRTPGGAALLILSGFENGETHFTWPSPSHPGYKAIGGNAASLESLLKSVKTITIDPKTTEWSTCSQSLPKSIAYIRALAVASLTSTISPIPALFEKLLLGLTDTGGVQNRASNSLSNAPNSPWSWTVGLTATPQQIEEILFCATELKNILTNALVADELDHNFRCLDCTAPAFKYHISKFPSLIDAIRFDFNFEELNSANRAGVFWECKSPDHEKLELSVRDLNKIIQELTPKSAVIETVQRLVDANASDRQGLIRFLNAFRNKVLQNLLTVPLEPKYHRVNLTKFTTAFGRPNGAVALFRRFGFEPEDLAQTHLKTCFPAPFDEDLFRFRVAQLDQILATFEKPSDDQDFDY